MVIKGDYVEFVFCGEMFDYVDIRVFGLLIGVVDEVEEIGVGFC